MKKIDYKKELSHYNASAKRIDIFDISPMNFLMINGKGNPNTSLDYKEAIEALFAVSYSLKFMIKNSEIAINYGVMPLEGLWWVEDMRQFDTNHKEDWHWTAMMMQPELITKDLVETAIINVEKKKNPNALSKLKFQSYSEGKVAQILHVGPFTEEGPTIEKLHKAITDQGMKMQGKHHEIYLSDTRRAAPEKWKTIIRQPVCE